MRTSHGCLTCKARKKKCDERRPSCVGCERNMLICTWGRNNREGLEAAHLEHSAGHDKAPEPSSTASGKASPPSQFNKQPEQSQARSKSSSMSRALRLSSKLVRTLGVRNIRNYPACLGRPDTAFLFDYYVNSAGKLCSAVVAGQSPFVHAVLPVALSSDMLLQSILAFSGFHFQQQYSSRYEPATLNHYALALRGLKHALTLIDLGQGRILFIGAFLSMLFLSCVDITRSVTMSHAHHHLRASRVLAHSVLQDPYLLSDGALRTFVTENYAYFLSLSTYSSDFIMDHKMTEDLNLAFSNVYSNQHETSGFLMGCAQSLFALIPRAVATVRLAAQHIDEYGGLSKDLSAELEHLTSLIADWDSPEEKAGAAVCSELYRLAILALLIFDSEDGTWRLTLPSMKKPRIAVLVDDFITLLQSLPPTEGISTTLCWPIAIVGSCAQYEYQGRAIRDYLSSMFAVRGFANIQQTLELLVAFWKRESFNTHAPVQLLVTIDHSYPNLFLV